MAGAGCADEQHAHNAARLFTGCLQELHRHLLVRHKGCDAAVLAARAAGQPPIVEESKPSVFDAMKNVQAARARADMFEEAELAAIAARKAADAEVASLEREHFSKKQRAESEEPSNHYEEWTPRTWLREETRVRGRRDVKLGTFQCAPDPRTGKDGYLFHARHGIVGCVQVTTLYACSCSMHCTALCTLLYHTTLYTVTPHYFVHCCTALLCTEHVRTPLSVLGGWRGIHRSDNGARAHQRARGSEAGARGFVQCDD